MLRTIPLVVLSLLATAPAHAGKPHSPVPHIEAFAAPLAGGVRLGVGVTGLTEELQVHFGATAGEGVLVSMVEPDSAAAAAGIQVGDVIVGLGEVRIRNGVVLRAAVQEAAGTEVDVEVIRGGKVRSLSARLAESSGPIDGQAFSSPGGEGRVWVHRGEGDLELDFDGIRSMIERDLGGRLEVLPLPDREFDDLHLRLDDLEQQMLEMTERLESMVDRADERNDRLGESR